MRLQVMSVALLLITLGILTACNSAEKTAQTSSTPASSTATPSDGVRRVTVAELKGLLDKGEVFVIDVRNQASYDAAHIKGSKLIPEAETLNHIDELPRNKLIVTYCS